MNMTKRGGTFTWSLRFALALITVLGSGGVMAASISVPNGSFESQSALGQPFGVNVFLDSWQKPPNPGIPEGGPNNFYWIQTAGAFLGTPTNTASPYSNLLGAQGSYILSIPGAGLFQDSQSTDWSGATNGLNATFEAGLSYELTVGVFGKGMAENYSTLQLGLFYREGAEMVTIGTPTTVTFSTATFNPAGPFALVDYSAVIPVVQPTDPWAGKNIGIRIDSALGTGDGYWDLDNVRLTSVVPEPGVLSLATLGAGIAAFMRRRATRQA